MQIETFKGRGYFFLVPAVSRQTDVCGFTYPENLYKSGDDGKNCSVCNVQSLEIVLVTLFINTVFFEWRYLFAFLLRVV